MSLKSMSNLAHILLIAIPLFVPLMFVDWVKGQLPDNLTPIPPAEVENLTPIPHEVENIMKQYCADSPNGNMKADLVDTGKINSTYAAWNCDYLEEKQKLMHDLGERMLKNLEDLKE